MKKACTALLALLLCLGLALPAFAEDTEPTLTPEPVTEPTPEPTAEPTPEPSPTEAPAPSAADAPTYSVSVTWGATEFTYHAADTWDPKALAYASAGSWSPESGSVTVANASTAAVVATVRAAIDSAVADIGTIGIALAGEPVRTLAVGASETFFYSLTGAPGRSFQSGVIGSLTVTITAPEGET